MYETRAVVGKGATLHQTHYPVADLYLEQIQEGSIILPLVGNLLAGATDVFNRFLAEPYRETANIVGEKAATFDVRVDTVRAQIASNILTPITQRTLK